MATELRQVKKELTRVTEERDILKKAATYFARVPVKYSFIRDHQTVFAVRTMCRVLMIHVSGFYAWTCRGFVPVF